MKTLMTIHTCFFDDPDSVIFAVVTVFFADVFVDLTVAADRKCPSSIGRTNDVAAGAWMPVSKVAPIDDLFLGFEYNEARFRRSCASPQNMGPTASLSGQRTLSEMLSISPRLFRCSQLHITAFAF
jgi:hypothetical protein